MIVKNKAYSLHLCCTMHFYLALEFPIATPKRQYFIASIGSILCSLTLLLPSMTCVLQNHQSPMIILQTHRNRCHVIFQSLSNLLNIQIIIPLDFDLC